MPRTDYVAIGVYEEHRIWVNSPVVSLGYDLRDTDYTYSDRKAPKKRGKSRRNTKFPSRLKAGWGRIGQRAVFKTSKVKRSRDFVALIPGRGYRRG